LAAGGHGRRGRPAGAASCGSGRSADWRAGLLLPTTTATGHGRLLRVEGPGTPGAPRRRRRNRRPPRRVGADTYACAILPIQSPHNACFMISRLLFSMALSSMQASENPPPEKAALLNVQEVEWITRELERLLAREQQQGGGGSDAAGVDDGQLHHRRKRASSGSSNAATASCSRQQRDRSFFF